MSRLLKLLSIVALLVITVPQTGHADDFGPDAAGFNKSRTQAINFLRNSQADDGSWTTANAPGITGLIVTSLLQSGVSIDDPTVALGMKHLDSHAKKDGGIYFAKSNHRNYETCIAILAFNAANQDGRYTKRIAAAKDFLKSLQWDKGEGLESTDPGFGGAGYGKHQRPDMSNTSFLVEALKTAGVGPDDPAMINALLFISRSQNLESEFNNTAFAAKVGDGGLYYTPAAGGSSQAGVTANGGLRSYGSMTYAGLKSMIYAGLKSDDKRVKAAMGWMKKFYTVDENPGLGMQGLYYYYHTFAKTMDVLKVDQFADADGTKHDWRKELAVKLFELQRENGSWVNKADRWYEGDPNLSTAYALMALSYCKPLSR
ncbi:MAG: terpene cyclase/mutase family protein [Planctomycetota bacterium]|nr:terpene cyclase/mutase family protein [Planctomycetota bacterium]